MSFYFVWMKQNKPISDNVCILCTNVLKRNINLNICEANCIFIASNDSLTYSILVDLWQWGAQNFLLLLYIVIKRCMLNLQNSCYFFFTKMHKSTHLTERKLHSHEANSCEQDLGFRNKSCSELSCGSKFEALDMVYIMWH